MEIKDLAGLSGPLQKLVQTVADGVGAIAHAWIVRREARALSDAKKILSEGGLVFESTTMKSLPAQIASRVSYQEAKRQINIGQVVDAAYKAMPEAVAEEPVDSDWTSSFFSAAQEISNEQMQQLWGRLLAGEVANPGTFSLRTIERLRCMTSSEARLFSEMCEFAFETPRGVMFILHADPVVAELPLPPPDILETNELRLFGYVKSLMSMYKDRGLDEQSFALLEELGLISLKLGEGMIFPKNDKSPVKIFLRNGSRLLTAEHDNLNVSIVLPSARLTVLGRELSQLHVSGVTPDFDRIINKFLGDAGFRVRWKPIEHAQEQDEPS